MLLQQLLIIVSVICLLYIAYIAYIVWRLYRFFSISHVVSTMYKWCAFVEYVENLIKENPEKTDELLMFYDSDRSEQLDTYTQFVVTLVEKLVYDDTKTPITISSNNYKIIGHNSSELYKQLKGICDKAIKYHEDLEIYGIYPLEVQEWLKTVLDIRCKIVVKQL